MEGGRLREVVAHGGSTVFQYMLEKRTLVESVKPLI